MRCSAYSPEGRPCCRPPHHEHIHPAGPMHLAANGDTWRAHLAIEVTGAPVRQVGARQSWADAQATAYGHGRG